MPRRTLVFSLAVMMCLMFWPTAAAGDPDCVRGEEKEARLALGGLDPVLLVSGRTEAGKRAIRARHEGFSYRFYSDATRRAFQEEPDRYGIQLQGFCPVSPELPGKSNIYLVHEGRIYLFFSEPCRETFRKNPKSFLPL